MNAEGTFLVNARKANPSPFSMFLAIIPNSHICGSLKSTIKKAAIILKVTVARTRIRKKIFLDDLTVKSVYFIP